jgi:hypothetical protein
MRRRWVSKPQWIRGFQLTMIGRELDRWIFSSSSLVLITKEIVDWWGLGKQGFPLFSLPKERKPLERGLWGGSFSCSTHQFEPCLGF